MIDKKSKLDFLIFVFAFSIVYLTSAVEISFRQESTIGFILKTIMTIVPFFYCIQYYLTKRVSKKVFNVIFIAILFYIIEAITYFYTVGELTLYIIKFILFFLFCYLFYYQKKDFDKYIYNVIVIIAIYSLILYFIINIVHIGLPFKKFAIIGSEEFYYDYYDIYFYRRSFDTIINIGPFSFDRLSSLFWEPGVYGVYLIYALYINLFSEEKYWGKKFSLIILVLSICFTFSTTALCIMISFFAIKIMKSEKLKPYIKVLIVLPTVLISLLGIGYILISKMTKGGLGEVNSFFARISDITVSMTLFFQNIISGTGFNNTSEFKVLQGYGRGCSNGFMIWLFTTGTVGILFASFPYIINMKRINNKSKRFYYIIYIVMIILLNMTEPISTSPLMTYILAKEYGLFCQGRGNNL